MHKLVPALAVIATLSACATQPQNVTASSVSPVIYNGMSCSEMKAEATRIENEVLTLTGRQKKKATNDAVAMGAGLVLFWPALFLVAAGEDVSPQLAQAKGQADALNAAYARKGCK